MAASARISSFQTNTVQSLTTTWALATVSATTRNGIWLYNPSGNIANVCYLHVSPGGTSPSGAVSLDGSTAANMPDGELIPGQTTWVETGVNAVLWLASASGTLNAKVRETA